MICSVFSPSGLVAEARLEGLASPAAMPSVGAGDDTVHYTVRLLLPQPPAPKPTEVAAISPRRGGPPTSPRTTKAFVAPALDRPAVQRRPSAVQSDVFTVPKRDVFPFGHTSPTKVFATPGTHCAHGIVQRMTDTGEFEVLVRTASGATAVETFDLLDMALPASLTHDAPQQPYPVGTIVLCRRVGKHGYHKGVVALAHCDLRYTVSFSPKHFADEALYRAQGYDITAMTDDTERVLHRNVMPKSFEFSEAVRVRDGVTVSTDRVYNAEVVSCLGSRRYKVRLLNTNEHAVVSYVHIGKVTTRVTQSLGSYPQLFQLFLSLDVDQYGNVSWKDARRAILAKVETFSMPVPHRVVRGVLERLTVLRGGSLRDIVGTSASEDAVDFRLSYDAFHFIAINIENSVSLK
jgi:hypothetical protein